MKNQLAETDLLTTSNSARLEFQALVLENYPFSLSPTANGCALALSALALLLNKYSAYISDGLNLKAKLQLGGVTTIVSLQKTIQQTQPVHAFVKELTNDLQEILNQLTVETPVDIELTWVSDNDEPGNDYCFDIKGITENGCEVSFVAPKKSFYAYTFRQSAQHLTALFQSIAQHPQQTISSVNYIGTDESSVLATFNYGPQNEDIAMPELLHHLFEQTANQFPDQIAVQSGEQKIPYAEMDVQANQLAHALIKRGVRQGDFVGIVMRRRPEVFMAMLAVLKAGGVYVPLDNGFPEERINYILNDCKARLVITGTPSANKTFSTKCDVFNIDLETTKHESPHPPVTETTPDSPAYAIYTSGTTGRPKGVIVPHRSATNLVKAEGQLFGLNHTDRILQGFSVAFDASVEEIWLAFRSGATLVQAHETVMYSGMDLAQFINEQQITAVSTVPTMLSMIQPPLPTMRLLILGGEYCPYELLAPWHSPELRIVNTYGPTEATVIATYSDFILGEKMTIGKPVTNYATFVLDQHQHQVPIGAPGELCIGGSGLAMGYLNQPELTAEKFVQAPFDILGGNNRIYRSGDLARFNEEGNIEFLGRIDSQVKLRGYRIELSEIESQLLQFKGIKNAVVAVKQDEHKVQRLVVYLILKDKTTAFSEELCKAHLKSRLASYMVPSVFMVMDEFPVLPSGKVDRKQLPLPEREQLKEHREIIAPRNATETTLHQLWEKYFTGQEVSIADDFFDLGGHSLLASLIVSELRRIPDFARISVQDIYTFRTIERLAQQFAELLVDKNKEEKKGKKEPVKRVSKSTYLMTTLAQALSLMVITFVGSMTLLVPYIAERFDPWVSIYRLITYTILSVFAVLPLMVIISVTAKWLIIGKIKAGRYPLWGWYYFRFWLVKRLVDLTPTGFLAGTPFLNIYFRMMGAKIGKGVYMGSERIRAFDMITIGERSSISREAHLMGYSVEGGELIIGPVTIGSGCFLGTRAVIAENASLENNASMGELSLLMEGQTIPEGEYWEGSPAAKAIPKEPTKENIQSGKAPLPFAVYLASQILGMLFVLVFPLLLTIPFALIFFVITRYAGFATAVLFSVPTTGLYIITFCLLIALFKWIIVGQVKEEDFHIYSFRYVRKWTVDMLLHLSLVSFRSIYATLYLPPWLRLMGAKIGKIAEISTVNQMSTDLLQVGAGTFLADSVSIGSPEVRNNMMHLRKITIGNKTFIGNSAVITSGDVVGSESLIGVLSTPPTNIENGIINGTSWLGSPAMFLPKRQESQKFDDKYTFRPTKRLYATRGIIEVFKITLPYAISTALLGGFYFTTYEVMRGRHLMNLLWLGPLLSLATIILASAITLFFKWTFMGTYKPSNKPLWSMFVWKNELVNSICESMQYPLVVNMFLGTPFAPVFFRMMGCKIGKGVYMETTEITEFDLVNVADYASLNYMCTIQTHLFEDRVMKMSNLYIGKDCTVGSMSVVLYDSRMEDGSIIDALSLVMKGEVIPADTKWAGSPARFVE